MCSSHYKLDEAELPPETVARACSATAGRQNPVSYLVYHKISRQVGDCDPANEMLRYVCDRFELNIEQRYWLAYLFATCYCGPTVYYMYNEFPDFENVDFGRLERWWAANKSALYFQTDRRWVRSRNQWCDMLRSYTCRVGRHGSQEAAFNRFRTKNPYIAYDGLYEEMGNLYQMGRYGLFLYLEAVNVTTGFPMKPRTMDMKQGSSESSRNGLAYAIGSPELSVHGKKNKLPAYWVRHLQSKFNDLAKRQVAIDPTDSVWSLETTLCAYKKYCIGKRYVGYYLDRQANEIRKLEQAVPNGVDWSVLWDYRRETYEHRWLAEMQGK